MIPCACPPREEPLTTLRQHRTVLGRFGVLRPAVLPDTRRSHHVHVVGDLGSGKSYLLAWMIVQDIAKGYSTIVIDPHGDLVRLVYQLLIAGKFADWRRLVPWTPGHLASGRVHTWNLLRTGPGLDAATAAGRFVTLCKRIWAEVNVATAGMPLFSEVASNVLTIAAANNLTLFDSHKIIADPMYRRALLRNVDNPAVAQWFARCFERPPSGRPLSAAERLALVGSFTRRVNAFEQSEPLRLLFGSRTSTLDFAAIVRDHQVLLADLSGLAETDELKFLMALTIQALTRVIFARTDPATRTPCAVYVDEAALVLGELGTAAMLDNLATQSRKFGALLTLAHQGMAQVPDPALRASLLRLSTQVCFAQQHRDDAAVMARTLFTLDLADAVRHAAKRTDQFDKEWLVPELWEQHIAAIQALAERQAYVRCRPLPWQVRVGPWSLKLRWGAATTRRLTTHGLAVAQISDEAVQEQLDLGLRLHARDSGSVLREVDARYARPRAELAPEPL